MSGACAGLIDSALELESFHRGLAEGPLLLHSPLWGRSEIPPNLCPLSRRSQIPHPPDMVMVRACHFHR